MALKEKIDPSSAFIARVHIPAEDTVFDGLLREEDVDLVVARGRGKFEGRLMVQIGEMRGRAPVGIIYRPVAQYRAFRQGKEIYIDPNSLRKGNITTYSTQRGLWVPLDTLGNIDH